MEKLFRNPIKELAKEAYKECESGIENRVLGVSRRLRRTRQRQFSNMLQYIVMLKALFIRLKQTSKTILCFLVCTKPFHQLILWFLVCTKAQNQSILWKLACTKPQNQRFYTNWYAPNHKTNRIYGNWYTPKRKTIGFMEIGTQEAVKSLFFIQKDFIEVVRLLKMNPLIIKVRSQGLKDILGT